MARSGPPLRRLTALALIALAAVALVPAAASAATPAELRLLGTEPEYATVTVRAVDGRTVTASPGMLRLRVNPIGAPQADRRGFCVDLHHLIEEGRDYDVTMTTAADDPALAGPRLAEAAWLMQSAEGLIAARPSAARALEAGALQVAIWQLVGEARENLPTDDAALNARAAALRALAAGRAIGGPVAIAPEMSRGCAGRGTVRLRVTGVPGSSATLTAPGGAVSPSTVTFGADGSATAAVSSSSAGTVTVTATSAGGTLTRLVRARAGQTTPQETMVLVPAGHRATATVTFEDCPLIPLEEDRGTPVVPTDAPAGPQQGPLTPFETPSSTPVAPPAASPPAGSVPHTPTQTGPRLRLRKSGPARVRAGVRAVYVIRVTNGGSEVARGVRVTDLLPDGMSLTAVPAGARLDGGRVVWTLATLGPRSTRTLRVRVRIDADIAGRRCNRARATVPGAPAAAATSCTRIVAVPRTLLPAVTA
jgi:uncharacterized repeat protein (TIGR01451 family)